MLETLARIDTAQRLYVLHAGDGYSALGFEVAQERAERLAGALQTQAPDPATMGTAEHYEAYAALQAQAFEQYRATRRRYECELTPQLVGLEGARVEVTDTHGDTRRFWVGRSTGWLPVHLEIARRDSSGGGAVYGAPFRNVRVLRRGR